jgi:hypothetical protein
MSYTTITESTNDVELLARIRAAIAREAWANEDYGATADGQLVREAGPDAILNALVWPCCIDFEADYAYAVESGHEHPGGDEVIPDAEVQSAVQTHWRTPPVEPAPQPATLTSLMPTSAAVGASNVELHAFGTGFADDAVLVFDGADQETTVMADGEVTATVDMPSAPGRVLVLVRSGGDPTGTQPFDVGGS